MNAEVSPRSRFVVPLLMIGIGVGWLLSALGIGEGIDWIWTVGLGVIGLVAFVISGLDKFSVVVGPFFLTASLLSVLRQTGRLTLQVEIPVLIIVFGVLLLLAQLPLVPVPRWMLAEANESSPPTRQPDSAANSTPSNPKFKT